MNQAKVKPYARGCAHTLPVRGSCLWLMFGVLGCETLTAQLGGAEPRESTPLIVEADTELGRYNSPGRECADGGDLVSYSVAGIDGPSLELDGKPAVGCLAPDDEVLLIVVQAPIDELSRAGQHQLLRVDTVTESTVSLVTAPTSNWNGLSQENGWRIVLQRVPSYKRLTVASGSVLSAPAWNGKTGGMLVLRILGDATIDGEVSMSGAGFRGGAERTEVLESGLQGESVAGVGAIDLMPNIGGGGGGLGDQTTGGCIQDGNAGGGGGHSDVGQDAQVSDLCGGAGRGRGGAAYATPGHLSFGSGGGSGGVDNVRRDNPPGAAGGAGGGLVWLLAQSLDGAGSIRADGTAGGGDAQDLECQSSDDTYRCFDHSGAGGGGAGGSIRLDAPLLGLTRVSVAGGPGGNGLDSAGGNGGNGGGGVIEQ